MVRRSPVQRKKPAPKPLYDQSVEVPLTESDLAYPSLVTHEDGTRTIDCHFCKMHGERDITRTFPPGEHHVVCPVCRQTLADHTHPEVVAPTVPTAAEVEIARVRAASVKCPKCGAVFEIRPPATERECGLCGTVVKRNT